MDNAQIARYFQELGELMELHGENSFKIRSYQTAYLNLRKLGDPLTEMPAAALEALPGIGKAIAAKIQEIGQTGKMRLLEEFRSKTPEGVQEMLGIKGLGPKKLRVIWQELGVESVGELQYALLENRLLELKGFGPKTQEELSRQLAFYISNTHRFLFARAEKEALDILHALRLHFPGHPVEWTGALRRLDPILEKLSFLIGTIPMKAAELSALLQDFKETEESITGNSPAGFPVEIFFAKPADFFRQQFLRTAGNDFLPWFQEKAPEALSTPAPDEESIFMRAGFPYLAPELRDDHRFLDSTQQNLLSDLIEATSIQGVIHTHTTFSDGLHSIEEMASECQRLGYGYLVISDHSRSAVYANGLSIDRLEEQWRAIDVLNSQYPAFRLFKGIECDILSDGRLDYPDEVLGRFDVVIASIHSQLKMDEEKATQRLIKAIEHPATRILGHPTGRLLLSRPGYPIHHQKIIDACARNGVAIELNANPHRLDLDYAWIHYAVQQEVLISINPDAHSKSGISDIRHGIIAARKGGLPSSHCLNTKDTAAFLAWLQQKGTPSHL